MTSLFQKPIWQNLASIGLGLLMLVPLMALALYNHASPADDYCYIDTVFKYGWFEAMKYYYTGWYGRYFAIFLNHSNPLIFHWFAGFKVIPFILYFGLIHSLFLLVRTLNPRKDLLPNLGITSALFYLIILHMASIVESFFWVAAVVNYTVPNIFTILWIVLSIKMSKHATRAVRVGQGILSALLVLAINGCSENNLFVIMILISAWFGYRLIFHRKLDRFYLLLLLWGIATALFSYLSPGNAVRLAGNPNSQDFLFSLFSALQYAPKLLFGWIINPSFLLLTILWIGILPRLLKRESGRINPYFTINPLYAILVTGVIILSQIFPSYYGIGIAPTPRVINCISFYFLIGWFYTIGVIVTFLARKRYLSLDEFPTIPFLAKPVFLLLIGINFYFSNNPRMMYGDWLGGSAKAYDQEMTERTRILMTSEESTIALPPLQNKPQTLYLEDISTNPEHLWNRCTAGYFGKKVIYLSKESAK